MMLLRCPVCHRKTVTRVVKKGRKVKILMGEHRSGSRQCSGTGKEYGR